MRWAKGLAVHAVLWALAYAGLVAGNAAAENVLLFALWAVSVLLMIGALAIQDGPRPERTVLSIVQILSSIGLCGVMAAESRFVLASAIALSLLLIEAKRRVTK